MSVSPRQVVDKFIDRFNARDAKGVAALYHEDAEHDRIALDTIKGRDVMLAMFERGFKQIQSQTIPINILVDGNTVLLEWRDTVGMRGCNVFVIEDGLIRYQRSYWDKINFQKFHPEMFSSAAEASSKT